MDQAFVDHETARLRAMTAEDKVRMIEGLTRTAQLLVAAGVRMRFPPLGDEQVEAETRRILSHATV